MSGAGGQEAAVEATATAAVQRQAVKVSTTPILPAMPREEERDDLEVLVRVEAPEVGEKFAPIDLVAVLDVSTSMGWVPDGDTVADKGKGEQSKIDLLKAAMTFVVKMLHLDDRLAIVEFNGNVKHATELLEISEEGRTSFLERVNKLEPDGWTAFRPGLEKAVNILNERTANGDTKRVGVIVFLSDGEENTGRDSIPKIDWDNVSTDPEDSLRRTLSAYPVHTFGFSKFHDSKALHLIAKFSDGTYSFINQGLGEIKDAFAVCLGRLQTVVAVDVTINLKANAAQGVKIKSIDSGAYKSHVKEGGESGDIRIPILYAAEKKNFIVHLSVPAASAATGDCKQLLITACGQCQDASAKLIRIEPEKLSIQRPVDVADKDSRRNQEVLQQMARFKVLRFLATFQERYKGLKNDAKLEQQEAGGWLLAEWVKLKETSSLSEGGGQLDLGPFEEDVQEMVRNLKEGLGVAYIYSWESSHQMERATTMGSPEKVAAAYVTPAINKMAQVAQQPPEENIAPLDLKKITVAADSTPPTAPCGTVGAPAAAPAPTPAQTEEDDAHPKPEGGVAVVPEQATSSAEKVKIVLPVAGDNKVIPYAQEETDLPVLVRVVAPPKKERAPIDLVALLDVSNSMDWKTSMPGWTRLDLVKGAMQLVTRNLGAGDRLAIVPFHGQVAAATALMEMNEKGKNDALVKVRRLQAGGDTEFLPALKYAWDLLEKRPVGEKTSRPGFVFLLSDGEDKSVLNPQSHIDNHYPVHTFGMCQKCNPQSMLHIASKTGGTYHPVNDKLSNIAHALGVFLGGITSVVAVNTSINFSVPDGSGVRIKNVDSGSYTYEVKKKETSGTIKVGPMYAHEEKKFIVHLHVPKMDSAPEPETQHVLTVGGGYNNPTGRKVESIDEKHVHVTRPGSTDTAKPTGASTYYQLLMVEIIRVKVLGIVTTVVDKHKDLDEPDHQQMANQLKAEWDKFKESHEGQQEAMDLKEGLNLYDHAITDMHARLNQEEYVGVLYVHAWLASNRTQQATTMAASASSSVVSWFHQQYMQQTAAEAVFHASELVTRPWGGGQDSGPCKCVDFDRIDQRLDLWSRVKREVPLLFQPSEDAESHHLTAVFREASLDAINRAMHHDMYLAVVHASNLRRCYCAGKQPQAQAQAQAQQHGSNEAPPLDVAKPREY